MELVHGLACTWYWASHPLGLRWLLLAKEAMVYFYLTLYLSRTFHSAFESANHIQQCCDTSCIVVPNLNR